MLEHDARESTFFDLESISREPMPLFSWCRNLQHAACFVVLAAVAAPIAAQTPALMRYNTIVESTYLIERCGELTPERRVYLRNLTDIAKRPLEWSPDQWAAHDAALAQDLARMYPTVPKERCAEIVRSLEQEMKNPPAK